MNKFNSKLDVKKYFYKRLCSLNISRLTLSESRDVCKEVCRYCVSRGWIGYYSLELDCVESTLKLYCTTESGVYNVILYPGLMKPDSSLVMEIMES